MFPNLDKLYEADPCPEDIWNRIFDFVFIHTNVKYVPLQYIIIGEVTFITLNCLLVFLF